MLRYILTTFTLILLLSPVQAGVVTLMSTDVGTYGPSSFFTNGYTVAELDGLPELSFRNYAVFDLSSINAPIVSAQLVTDSGADVGRFHDVTISLQSYSDSIPALSGGTANFADLASGNPYSSLLAPSTLPNNSTITFDLNPAALADLNGANGLFAIAGSQPNATFTSGLFAGVTESRVSLVLSTSAVPEPSTIFAMLAVTALAFLRRRWRKLRCQGKRRSKPAWNWE